MKDGIHCKEYFYMESGTVKIASAGDDGIQVEGDDESATTGTTSDHEDENSGSFYQDAGKLDISGYAGKAIKADGIIRFKGGSRNFPSTDTEDATAIAAIAAAQPAGSGCYDLQGRRVTDTRKGIYIFKNGNTTTKRYIK